MTDDDDTGTPQLVGEVTSAILALALGSQAGDAALGALTAAAAQPVLNHGLQGGIRQLALLRQRQLNVAAETASEETGLPIEELVERLMSEPTRAEIFRLALIAAANTGYEEKARTVGRSLATGALERDRAKLDLEVLFLRAMADVDPPHVNLLASFTRSSRDMGLGEGEDPKDQWNSHQLGLVHGDRYGPGLPALVATLERHGLLERRESGGGSFGGGGSSSSWKITPLGLLLLDRLRRLGEPV